MSAQWMKSWLFRLLRNLIEFATVAVPGASLVHYLKRAKFLDAFKQNAEQVESDNSEDEEDDSEDDRDVMLRLLNGPDYDEEDDDDEDYIYDEEEEDDDEESDDDNEEWDDGEDNEQLQTQKDFQTPEKNASPLKCEKKEEKENESASDYAVHKYQDLKHFMLSEKVIMQDNCMFHPRTKEIATGVMVPGDCEPPLQ